VVESTCSGVTVKSEDFSIGAPCTDEYKMIREWTATNDCGQIATTYQTIIIRQDTVAPVLSLENAVKFAGCGTEADTLRFDTPDFWDNCEVTLVGTVDTTVYDHEQGDSAVIRTWTYADPCGNASSISQTLIFGATDKDDYFRSERDTFNLSCVSDLKSYEPLVYSCETLELAYTDVRQDSTCMNQVTIIRTWTASDELGNVDTLVQVFYINDTIAPVIDIASDTLFMTSLEYEINGAGSNIVSIMDNCGSAFSDIVIQRVEENGNVKYEYEVIAEDACGNIASRSYVVIISERPPIVHLQYVSPAVIAQVDDGIYPFDYSWSYLKPGSDTWVTVNNNNYKLDVSQMGIIRKVRVRVTDANDQVGIGELELSKIKRVFRNVTMHPNPATEYVEVRTEMEDVNRIELYNVWGQRVKVYEFDQMDDRSRLTLDLRDVPQGSYSVRFLNGHTVYTRQLIKVK